MTTSKLPFALFLLGGAAFAQTVDFDLVEINKAPNPADPGIDYAFVGVVPFEAEAGGINAIDFNNDGWVDLFFPNTEGQPNKLYVNQGDGTFVDQAAALGVDDPVKRTGNALFFDMENDGDLDLVGLGYPGIDSYSTLYTLYRNNGMPAYDFTDVTASAGGFQLAPTQELTVLGEAGGACAGDLDGDTFAEFFVTYWNRNLGGPVDQPRLWKNALNPTPIGPGQTDYSPRVFLDDTINAGLDVPFIGTLGDAWLWMPAFVDLDRDGFLDLRLNVEWGLDVLRLNNGDGTFGPDIALSKGYAGGGNPPEERNEMGMAFGDPDLDLDLDSYHTNAHLDDTFYRNDSDLSVGGPGIGWTEIGTVNGTSSSDIIGWGCLFTDIDNDADEDLLHVVGLTSPDYNFLHMNMWPQLAPDGLSAAFADVSSQVPDFSKRGQTDVDVSRALTMLDYDNDGDMDLVVGRQGIGATFAAQVNPKAGFFENVASHNRKWIEVDPVERQGSLNTIGARIFVKSGGALGRVQMREVIAGSSYLSQEPYRKHFGLGDDDADWVVIRWQDGTHDVLLNPVTNAINKVEKKAVDPTGDLNGDGVVDSADVSVFFYLQRRPKAVITTYHPWPVQILGDINGDNSIDNDDLLLLQVLAQ